MKKPSEREFFRIKVLASALLLLVYGSVVFSVPAERLAWQGAYVMGTLLLPKPSPGPYVRSDAMRDNSDSSFSLLGFFSVIGIIGLVVLKVSGVFPVRGGRRAAPRPSGTVRGDRVDVRSP